MINKKNPKILNLTQKIRIYPAKEQENVLWDLSEKCRLIYNFALEERKENWRENQNKPKTERKYVTYNEQSARLPEIKNRYPEYKWLYSKVLQQTVKKLDESFKSFFSKYKKGDKDARPPRFKGKYYFTTLCYNQSGFKITEKNVKFSHKHPSKIPLMFEFKYPYKGTEKVKQIEIKREVNKKWYVAITYEKEKPKYLDNGLYYAIDLGVINLVSGVNLHLKTTQFKNRRADLYWKKKISEIQSKRDHCKGSKPRHKKSKRYLKYNNKLCKMMRKSANQMRDYQHFVAKKVIENTRANTIIVGDLPIKKMSRKKKGTGNARKNKANKTRNHSMYNTGSLGRFVQFLSYKAEKIGKRVVRIDESYTSQTCCVCGKRKKRGLHERIIECDCGNRIDRDVNGSINIMERFIRHKQKYAEKYDFLSQESSMAEVSFLNKLDMLRYTAPSSFNTGDGGLVVS